MSAAKKVVAKTRFTNRKIACRVLKLSFINIIFIMSSLILAKKQKVKLFVEFWDFSQGWCKLVDCMKKGGKKKKESTCTFVIFQLTFLKAGRP